jgi:L-fucose mutarotase
MGHGDEIVLVDANYPAVAHAKRLVRLPGTTATAVLEAVLSVLPLDNFVPQAAFTMQVVGDEHKVPIIVSEFNTILNANHHPASSSIERFEFYERAKQAFAVVATGEGRVYGNISLKKGVIGA